MVDAAAEAQAVPAKAACPAVARSDLSSLLASLGRAQDDVLAATEALPWDCRERSGACGTWTAREVVVHLAAWDREAVVRLKALLREPGTPDVTYDVDGFNADAVAAAPPDAVPWAEAVAELRAAQAALLGLLGTVGLAAWMGDPRFREWAASRAEDDALHADQLRAWAGEGRGDPWGD
jgi:hypothetical protein